MSIDGIKGALGLPRPGLDADERAKLYDGRNVDGDAGILMGEGAHQHVKKRKLDTAYPLPDGLPVVSKPTEAGVQLSTPDYYGQPMLKETVWTWMIPAYFFVGGMAGASSALGGALYLAGGPEMRRLERQLRYVATAGDMASSALLIADLGKPTRFLYMLRMLRVTSPMSVGSWVLAGSGALNTLGALLASFRGPLGKVGDLSSLAASALGLPLSGYTAVLLSNTAVPVWQHARRSLPGLFVASSAASAGSALQLIPGHRPHEQRVIRTVAIAGQVAELVLGFAVEREAGRVERVTRPLSQGFSGALWKGAKVLTGAALALNLLPRRTRGVQLAAGAASLAGSFAMRYALQLAGKRSARDPQAAFQAQRSGLGGVEATGKAPKLGPSDDGRSFRLPVLR